MAESLESGITCPLCLELYQDPKILPCGHIYCRDPCLTGLARQRRDRTISCPECRKIAQVPQGDVSTFPTVYKIVSLVDSHKARKVGRDQPDSSSTRTCEIHEGQEFALYCETCSKTLCRDCILDTREHNGHTYSYIKNIIADSRTKLLAQSSEAQAVEEALENTLDRIKSVKETISNQHAVVGREIDSRVAKAMESLKTALHSQLDRISDSKVRSLEAQQLKLIRTQSVLQQSTKTVKSALENLSSIELMTEIQKLQAMLTKATTVAHTVDLNPTVDGNIGFCCDDLIATVRRFHLYSGKAADPSNCSFQSEDLKAVQIDKVVKISVKVLDSRRIVCPEEQAVTTELHCLHDLSMVQQEAKAIQSDQYVAEITLKNRGRHMLAIKVNGRHIFGSPTPMFVHMPPHKLGAPVAVIDGLSRPVGLHNWNGKIIACDMKNDRLIEIDKKCPVVSKFGNTLNGPAELSSDSSSNAYVTMWKDNCLRKLDRHGQVIKTIGSTGKEKEQFDLINGVNVSGSLLYVCDTRNHRIKVYDLQLNLIEIIGKKGTKLGQFRYPDDVTFDREGNMYVTDEGNN